MEKKCYLFEEWRDIPGYEGLYQVSSFGRVKSLWFGKEKILKPSNNGNGYLFVNLYNGKVCRHKNIHRLVAEVFIPNPNNYPCVNHKDCNRSNNFVFINPDGSVNPEKSNLEWCTHSYNNSYADAGKKRGIKRSKKVFQYTIDGEFVAEWEGLRHLERETGFSEGNTGACCRGVTKQAYGFVWKYA